ncbi:hypothetical protein [Mesorhizobium sp. J428]|uniref:hypothetical protein n=1 Tax=Mesorhizobium sp. J428 TaxID=2898440 RepID=UPI0021510D85|nr:hypothetical protein [Mesorhizobium sp. J428]MCR5855454.1 hypothetical protein [Mesorhizobium sp. J428]
MGSIDRKLFAVAFAPDTQRPSRSGRIAEAISCPSVALRRRADFSARFMQKT